MKTIILALALALSLTACGQIDTAINDFKSSTGLLERDVTLYANDGHVIKQWKTSNQIEYVGPVAQFIDDNGTNVRISGTFLIEGK